MVQPHVVRAWALALTSILSSASEHYILVHFAQLQTQITASRLSSSLSTNGLCAEYKLKVNGSQVLHLHLISSSLGL